MENRVISERLREEAPSKAVGDCLAEMFAFEVANAPKARVEYRAPYGRFIGTHLREAADVDRSEVDDED